MHRAGQRFRCGRSSLIGQDAAVGDRRGGLVEQAIGDDGQAHEARATASRSTASGGSSVMSIGRSSSVRANFTKGYSRVGAEHAVEHALRDLHRLKAIVGPEREADPVDPGEGDAQVEAPRAVQDQVTRERAASARPPRPRPRARAPRATRRAAGSLLTQGVVAGRVSPGANRASATEVGRRTPGSMRQLRPIITRGGIDARLPTRVMPGVEALRLVAVRAEVVAAVRSTALAPIGSPCRRSRGRSRRPRRPRCRTSRSSRAPWRPARPARPATGCCARPCPGPRSRG